MASLQHVVACQQREDQRAFLMHQGDALGARSRVELVGLKAVQLDAAGERRDGAGDEAQ